MPGPGMVRVLGHAMIDDPRIEAILKEIPGLPDGGTLLNVGHHQWSMGRILSFFVERGFRVTTLEIHEPNVRWMRVNEPRVHERIVLGDVRRLATDRLFPPRAFDLCLWWHGPEHVERSEIGGALWQLEAVSKGLTILGCPFGVYEQGAFEGNEHEIHRCYLYPDDFERFGYRVATVGEHDKAGSIVAWRSA